MGHGDSILMGMRMMHVALLVTIVVTMAGVTQSQKIIDNIGYRLEPDPTYMIVAPRKIYPSEVIQVSITIFKLYYQHINVRGSIRKDNEEYANFRERFTAPSTRVAQMQMRDNASPGNYTLRIEGTINEGESGNIFENETDLIFDLKRVSVFITTNKPIYNQNQEVKFRVVPVHSNLLGVQGSIHIYVYDPTGVVVRRWLSQHSNAGILEKSFQLSDQPTYGRWKIQVRAWGYDYEKNFTVEEFYKPRMYVNVSMPLFIVQDSFGVAGVVSANYTSGRPVLGNGSIHLEIRPPLKHIDPSRKPNYPYIDRTVNFFEGKASFLFTMRELTDLFGSVPVGQEIHVNASVFDWFLLQNNTGEAVSVVYDRDVRMKLLGDYSRSFKPGFPVSVYFAVVQSDGSPIKGDRRQVTINYVVRGVNGMSSQVKEQKMIIRDDGIVHFNFVAPPNADIITLRAYYDTDGLFTKAECKMSRVFSKYDNYLHISTSTERPVVNDYMIFTIKTSTHVDLVYYLIVAGGNIVVGNRLEMKSTQKTFSVSLSRDMVPSARMVAYYLSNGEIVSDSLNFFVNGTELNPVNVRVNRGKDFSFDTVELTGTTDPGSFIAFSGIDYDLYSHGGNIFLTEKDIIEEMETYDKYANQSFSHTWYFQEERYEKVYFPAQSYGIDSNTTFTYAGLLVFTDANVTRIPHDCNETNHFLPCNDGVCYLKEQRCDGVQQCYDGVDEMGCEKAKDESPFTPPMDRMKHLTQHFLQDGSWLWRGHFVKPDGRIDLKVSVPKAPMSWIVGAFSVSRDKGLGVIREPARYQSSRPFYIEVEMPTHVVKGEQIGVRIAVFNYWDRFLECLVTLHDSDQYRFVIVEDRFQITSSYAPRTSRGDIQTMVYVEQGEMKTVYMPVLPVVDGDLLVTVSATSFMGRDTVSKPLHVVYDGVTNYYNTPYLIDLISSGFQLIPDFEIPVPERFIHPEQRKHLYVPGSPEAIVSIVGDVMGPGFFEPHLTADNLLRRPYGSGEQNMFNFAANLYHLKFLKITNKLTPEILDNALKHMNLDFQRMLGYMNDGGSFSMFRDYPEHTPSTWLSSFILQTLMDADETDWRSKLFIPDTLIDTLAMWLVTQQNNMTGAFMETAPVYDRKMLDNVTMENGVEVLPNVTLTAHVLIALAASAKLGHSTVDAAKHYAITYLQKHMNSITDPYQMAVVTYALTASKASMRNSALQRLDSMKITTEFTYWSRKPIPANPTRIHNTVPFNYPRLIYPLEGSAVEGTAYALMVYLRNNRVSDATPIMKWLQTMRNSIGGFAGTRDSIVALQALAEFGRRDPNRDLYDMQIKIEATSTPNFKRIIRLNKDNWMQTQLVKIPVVYGQVKASVSGTGMALMQLHTKVNVEHPEMMAPKPDGTFYNVSIGNLHLHGKNFSIMEMNVCSMWLRKDLGVKTGLTVLEVNIPTGYIIMNDVLRRYVQSGAVPTLRRAEFQKRMVAFYFDYLEYNTWTCVDFRADRWYPIANMTIQHEIKVYDYYEPGMFNRTLYTTRGLFTLHICQVCGSFQCPYCPYYNTAVPLAAAGPVIALFAGLLVFFIVSRLHVT